MSDLITQTARLVPYAKRPKQGAGFVTAYVYEPSPDDPAAPLGNLYIVMEALLSGRASEDITDLIIATFGDRYYNRAPEQPFALARFEEAVKSTNQELAQYVDRGNAAWIGKISCVIAVIVGDEVHIAHTGSAEGLLYRGKASSRITVSEARPATPTKTFGSIASGELEAGDRLLLATPALIHQVPLTALASTVANNSPSSAISELTNLLKGSPDRIAAIITETTTPELAAQQLRPHEPNEAKLGAPDTPLEAAKLATAPISDSTIASSKRLVGAAHSSWTKFKPLGSRMLRAAAATLRRILGSKKGRITTIITLIIVVIIIFVALISSYGSGQKKADFELYKKQYAAYSQSSSLPGEQAKKQLTDVSQELTKLKKSEAAINHLLANSNLQDGEPTSYKALVRLVSLRIDTLNGLETKPGQTVAEFKNSGTTASLLELSASKAYVVTRNTTKSSLLITDLASGATTSSKAVLPAEVKASAITSNGDGIYLLDSKPSVSLYKPGSDSLSQQTLSYGNWPVASSIGTYAANVYLLKDNTILKFVHAANGFSPQSQYASLAGGPAASASAITVDGSVYAVNATALTEFVSGTAKQTSALPQAVQGLSHLRVSPDSTVLSAVSASANRIVLWKQSKGVISFAKQIQVEGVNKIDDAVYSTSSKTLYVLAGNRLIKVVNPL